MLSSNSPRSRAIIRSILPIFSGVNWSTMRLDFFSKGDSVLLLGEGNFSFSVCLHRHQLPIHITATCFQPEPKSEDELKNIEYLKTNGVLVFFNVDATKLQENPIFADVKFSKIIFNFPHVGGKMKIHLNRELLRDFFLSAGDFLEEGGRVLVSLCQGQGGTPVDRVQRRWDDSWQIAEMAAHGDFILTEVEPFLKENFREYSCMGYRSQNVGFHLDGALVHVFSKKCFDDLDRLRLIPLRDSDSYATSDMCRRNPVLNPYSGISFLQKILIETLNEREVEVVEVLLLHTENPGMKCPPAYNPTDVFPTLFELAHSANFNKRFILYPAMYFPNSCRNFLTNPPVDFTFTISGKNLRSEIVKFLNKLIIIFKEQNTVISDENLLIYRNTDTGNELQVVEFHEFQCSEYCVLKAQSLCEYLFRVSWREIWADHKITYTDGIPILRPVLLYPSRYEFDITLRYTEPFSNEDLLKILWLGGGLLIEGVEFVSEYASDKWCSKCYRISYRSLDRPLFRKRVIKIHALLGRVLEAKLNVTVG